MKKTLSIILAILMIVTTIPMAFAADTPVAKVGDIEYTDFYSAFYDWSSGETLTLLADFTEMTKTEKIYGEDLILDLNGCALDSDDFTTFEIEYGNSLTVRDSKGGGIIYGDIMVGTRYDDDSADVLCLESGTIETVTVKNGNFIMVGGRVLGDDSYGGVYSYHKNAYMEISGGEITGKYGVNCRGGEVVVTGNAKISGTTNAILTISDSSCTVTGGVFSHDPTQYVPEGYDIINSEGLWYVCNHKDTIAYADAKAPTCTEIGWEAYEYCTACPYTTYAELPIDPDAHNCVTDEYKAPTCTEVGLEEGSHCGRCGETLVAQQEIEKLPHVDEDADNYCDGCGAEMLCSDCGRPVHEGEINEYICLLITFVKLIVDLVRSLGA